MPAIITFVGDFLKGVISVAIAYFIMWGEPELQKYYLMCTAGLFAVVGHTMPIYYKFKGGKGVVTTAAVMIMTDWRVLIVALLIFAVVFTATKIISVCALCNATAYPITAFSKSDNAFCMVFFGNGVDNGSACHSTPQG